MLKTTQEQRSLTYVITIEGTLDYSTIDRFEVDLPVAMNKIVIDLSALDFIDSTGIGAILTIIYEAASRDTAVHLEGLNETVKELFDTVGVFQIIDTLANRGE